MSTPTGQTWADPLLRLIRLRQRRDQGTQPGTQDASPKPPSAPRPEPQPPEVFFPDGLLPFESGAPVMPLSQFWTLNISEAITGPLREHIEQTLTAWTMSLPFTDEAKRLIQSAGGLLVYDWLRRALSYQAQDGGLPGQQLSYWNEFVGAYSRGRGVVIPRGDTFATYLAKLDVDGLLYQLSPEIYYREAIRGATGLTAEEKELLARYAWDIAQEFGPSAELDPELLAQFHPGYAWQRHLAADDLTTEERAQAERLLPQLLEAARAEGVDPRQFHAWLAQHPARQLLLLHDPEYAFDQFLAGANLRDNERQSLRRYFDTALAQWRQAGSPGSFHTWLGSQAGSTTGGQQGFLEGLDPSYAYHNYVMRGTGPMSEAGRRRVEGSYDRLYHYYREAGNRAPATFRDFLKDYRPQDVSLGSAPANLRDLVGRTRWLGF